MQSPERAKAPAKKRYTTPELRSYGSIAELTEGLNVNKNNDAGSVPNKTQ